MSEPSILTLRVSCGNQLRDFRLFDTSLGKAVTECVFSGKSYPLVPLEGPVTTILDIGANVGAASLFFALNYPQARILCFEPSPSCFELLTLNTADLTSIKVFPFGLFDRDRTASLHLGDMDQVTNSVGASVLNTGKSVPVELRAAADILRAEGVQQIDVLKLDTEGCELPIMRSVRTWLPHTGVIYVEFHDADDRRKIDQMLEETHVLYRGTISNPHRGELCYVNTDRVARSLPFHQMRIRCEGGTDAGSR